MAGDGKITTWLQRGHGSSKQRNTTTRNSVVSTQKNDNTSRSSIESNRYRIKSFDDSSASNQSKKRKLSSVDDGPTSAAKTDVQFVKRLKLPQEDISVTGERGNVLCSRDHLIPDQKQPPSFLRIDHSVGDIFATPPHINTLIIHACNTEGSWGAGIAAAFKKNYPSAYTAYVQHCRSIKKKGSMVGTALLIPPSNRGSNSTVWVGCLFTSQKFGQRRDSPRQILEATGPAMRDLLRQVVEWNERCQKRHVRKESNKTIQTQCVTANAKTTIAKSPTSAIMLGKTAGEAPSASSPSNAESASARTASENEHQAGASGRPDLAADRLDVAPDSIHSIRMCKINSGLFNVAWKDTLAVLHDIVTAEILGLEGADESQIDKAIRTVHVVSPE